MRSTFTVLYGAEQLAKGIASLFSNVADYPASNLSGNTEDNGTYITINNFNNFESNYPYPQPSAPPSYYEESNGLS
jgi:hypothetical protein